MQGRIYRKKGIHMGSNIASDGGENTDVHGTVYDEDGNPDK